MTGYSTDSTTFGTINWPVRSSISFWDSDSNVTSYTEIRDLAFLCGHAEISGKINALGIGFDTIYAQQVPARHPYFFLVAEVRASIDGAGDK